MFIVAAASSLFIIQEERGRHGSANCLIVFTRQSKLAQLDLFEIGGCLIHVMVVVMILLNVDREKGGLGAVDAAV